MRTPRFCLSLLLVFALSGLHAAERVAVAAAANLVYALDALNRGFKQTNPNVVVTSTTGASGSLFAQIKNGAPFDLFLSADTDYPRQIVAAGLGSAPTLKTFAVGRLVIWTTRADLDLSDIAASVRSTLVNKIAIAQPKAAPYGRAAQTALEKLGVWPTVQPKLVLGESIAQTAQFVETGNADIGFVALSLVSSPKLTNRGQWREIPPELYRDVPLDHAAVLTLRGAANPAAKRYLEYLSSGAAKKILGDYGYGIPDPNEHAGSDARAK